MPQYTSLFLTVETSEGLKSNSAQWSTLQYGRACTPTNRGNMSKCYQPPFFASQNELLMRDHMRADLLQAKEGAVLLYDGPALKNSSNCSYPSVSTFFSPSTNFLGSIQMR